MGLPSDIQGKWLPITADLPSDYVSLAGNPDDVATLPGPGRFQFKIPVVTAKQISLQIGNILIYSTSGTMISLLETP